MFAWKIKPINDTNNLKIGVEILLEGNLTYASEANDIEQAKKLLNEIEKLSASELIAINVKSLVRWDSLGINAFIKPLISINEHLTKRGRTVIALIGEKETDKFRAVHDKFPAINAGSLLPWYPAVSEFLLSVA